MAAAEDVEAAVEAVEAFQQGLWGKEAHARRRQLDGQRQAVQPAADLDEGVGVVRRDVEAGFDGLRPGREEAHRFRLADFVQGARGLAVFDGDERTGPLRREPQWRQRQLQLAAQVEPLPASGDHAQPWAAGKEIGHQRGGAHHLLEVVEDEQQVPVAQEVQQQVARRLGADLAQLQGAGDGHGDERGIGQRRQRDERGAVGELNAQMRRQIEGEAGLAGAAGPRQRQQPGFRPSAVLRFAGRRHTQDRACGGDLPFPPDERRRGLRHVAQELARRAQGRELLGQAGRHDLEDPLGGLQVLEGVLAEVAQGDVGREALAGQLAGRPRNDDLVAMCGRQQPRHAVQRRSEVVAAAHFGLAGMDGHAHPEEWRGFGPVRGQGALCRHGGVDGGCGGREDGAEGVAGRLEDRAAGRLDGAVEEVVVAAEGGRHGAGIALPEACTPLDVGEKEGEDRGLAFRHGCLSLGRCAHASRDNWCEPTAGVPATLTIIVLGHLRERACGPNPDDVATNEPRRLAGEPDAS